MSNLFGFVKAAEYNKQKQQFSLFQQRANYKPEPKHLCRFCKGSFSPTQIPHHYKVCDFTSITCNYCSLQLLVHQMREDSNHEVDHSVLGWYVKSKPCKCYFCGVDGVPICAKEHHYKHECKACLNDTPYCLSPIIFPDDTQEEELMDVNTMLQLLKQEPPKQDHEPQDHQEEQDHQEDNINDSQPVAIRNCVVYNQSNTTTPSKTTTKAEHTSSNNGITKPKKQARSPARQKMYDLGQQIFDIRIKLYHLEENIKHIHSQLECLEFKHNMISHEVDEQE